MQWEARQDLAPRTCYELRRRREFSANTALYGLMSTTYGHGPTDLPIMFFL